MSKKNKKINVGDSKPFIFRCLYCSTPYRVIAKFETFQNDLRWVIRYMFWNLLLYFSWFVFVCPVLVCDSRMQINSVCLIIQEEKVKRPILHSKYWQILWLRNLIIYVQIHRSASKCKFWHKSPRKLVQEWHRRCLTFGSILFPEGWLNLTLKKQITKKSISVSLYR